MIRRGVISVWFLWCFDMFDLEKWGGERVKEIDEMINFVEKSAKWLR